MKRSGDSPFRSVGGLTVKRTNGPPPRNRPLSLIRATSNNNNNNIKNIRVREGGFSVGGASPLDRKTTKVRTPRATTVHPCRICADPVTANSPETALHPTCRVEAPRCSICGRGAAIPNPNCPACAGTGTIATSACPWCPPAPCVTCVMAAILDGARRHRAAHERIRPCAACGYLSALPLGPLCAPCTVTHELYRDRLEVTPW